MIQWDAIVIGSGILGIAGARLLNRPQSSCPIPPPGGIAGPAFFLIVASAVTILGWVIQPNAIWLAGDVPRDVEIGSADVAG